MNFEAFKHLLNMSTSEYESELDRILHENFEEEAKQTLIEELENDIGVEREIIEAILEHNGIDYD